MVRGGGNAFVGFMVWGDQTLYRNDELAPGQYLTMVESDAPEPPTDDNDRHGRYPLAGPFWGVMVLLAILGIALAHFA